MNSACLQCRLTSGVQFGYTAHDMFHHCPPSVPNLSSFPGLVLWVWRFQSYSLYQFPIACITNCHELGDLPQTQIYYFIVQEKSEIGRTGLKSRYQQVYIPFGGSRREFISLFFPASRGYLHFLACSSLPSSKPAMVGQVFLMMQHSDTESPASLFFFF